MTHKETLFAFHNFMSEFWLYDAALKTYRMQSQTPDNDPGKEYTEDEIIELFEQQYK